MSYSRKGRKRIWMRKALSTSVVILYYAIYIGIAKNITLNEWWFSNEKKIGILIFFLKMLINTSIYVN